MRHLLLALLALPAVAADKDDWKRYTNSVLGVSIETPSDWTVRIGPGQARVDLLDPQYERTRGGLTLSSLPIPYSEDLFQRWKGALRQDDPKVAFQSEADAKIGAARAHQIIFLGNPPGGVQKHMMVFIEGAGKVYTLECSSRDEFFKTFEGFCGRAVASFAPVAQSAGGAGRVTSSDGVFSVQSDPGWENVTVLHQAQFKETVLALQSPRGMVNFRRAEKAGLKPEEIKQQLAAEAQGAVDKGAKFLSSQIAVMPNGIELYYVTLLQPSGQETLLSGYFQAGAAAYRVAGVTQGGDPLKPLDLVGGFMKTFKAESPEGSLRPAETPTPSESKVALEKPAEPAPPASPTDTPRPVPYRPQPMSPMVKFMMAGAIVTALIMGGVALYSLSSRTLEQNKPKG